ncbi:MAG TPA: efflux RND transporter periplasmic adaptor subunit, partial [Thermodesulfobacteriota bacterium]|nr:efflux RND transporter periplasmic adaptor subunit [Thermodesulfobacteriota bacterium]
KERYDSLVEQGLVSRQAGEQVTLQYDTGRYRLAESAAVLDQAQSNLKKIAAIEREIEAARAQIRVARATLDVATIQLGYAILRAPFSGIITVRRVEPGEVVSPGESVFSLADLSTVELKIFVPETDLGLVKPGQPVEVRTDTFPNTVYHGQVGYISPEGEFTPKIIQTHKERVKLVYLVKVIIPNPSLELKTGMPADAWLAELPDES